MYKIDAEEAHKMIAVIQEHAKIPKDAIELLQKNVDKQITAGETQDFYQGFLSALSQSDEPTET